MPFHVVKFTQRKNTGRRGVSDQHTITLVAGAQSASDARWEASRRNGPYRRSERNYHFEHYPKERSPAPKPGSRKNAKRKKKR